MVDIQPSEKVDADYAAYVAIRNAIWPHHPTTVEEAQHWDRTRDPAYEYHSFKILCDGKVVGICVWLEPWWAARPGKYYIEILIHPDYERQGMGSAAYEFLMAELDERDPVILESQTREDKPHAVRFLEQRGFKLDMRLPRSELEVASFDFECFAALRGRMHALGVQITTLAELQREDSEWQRKMWDLDWELAQDVPSTDPFTRQPFDVFVERTLGAPNFLPDAQFIAIDDGRWVGMSALWKSLGDPKRLHTGFTGVARTHRRKGVATAMKVEAIRFARVYGAEIIDTDNEENNPMYQLNLQLGFQPRPAILFYRRQMKAE